MQKTALAREQMFKQEKKELAEQNARREQMLRQEKMDLAEQNAEGRKNS